MITFTTPSLSTLPTHRQPHGDRREFVQMKGVLVSIWVEQSYRHNPFTGQQVIASEKVKRLFHPHFTCEATPEGIRLIGPGTTDDPRCGRFPREKLRGKIYEMEIRLYSIGNCRPQASTLLFDFDAAEVEIISAVEVEY